jgi:hypothetical protein
MVNGMEYCPDCGSQVLHIEGCNLCPCCGWSACGCGIYCEKRKPEEDAQELADVTVGKDGV